MPDPRLAQAMAVKMAGGPPGQAGPAPDAVDPQMVQQGRQLLQQLLALLGQGGPQVVLALKDDLMAFSQMLRQLMSGGQPPGAPPPGGPPMGGPPQGAGAPPPPPGM